MTQTERFLQYVQRSKEQEMQITLRLDGDALIVTRRWQQRSIEIPTMPASSLTPKTGS